MYLADTQDIKIENRSQHDVLCWKIIGSAARWEMWRRKWGMKLKTLPSNVCVSSAHHITVSCGELLLSFQTERTRSSGDHEPISDCCAVGHRTSQTGKLFWKTKSSDTAVHPVQALWYMLQVSKNYFKKLGIHVIAIASQSIQFRLFVSRFFIKYTSS